MNNKTSINLLFFDDDPSQYELINSRIIQQLNSYNVGYWVIDPNEFYDAEHDLFNLVAFKTHIFETIKGNQINVIATDWNLFDSPGFTLKGLDIVKCMLEINPKYAKAPYVIYSGNIDDASKYTLSLIQESIIEAKEKGNESINSIEIINNLLKTRIEFIKRGDHSFRIIELVKGELNLKSVIVDSFRKLGLARLNSTGNVYFDGKTLDDLVQLIEQDDIKGLRFIQEFTELSISHYSELNA